MLLSYREQSYSTNLRQFDAHEDPTHEEGNEDAGKAHTQQQNAVEARHEWLVHLVQHNEAQATKGKHETGRQPLHDVLAIDTVWHERHLVGHDNSVHQFNILFLTDEL